MDTTSSSAPPAVTTEESAPRSASPRGRRLELSEDVPELLREYARTRDIKVRNRLVSLHERLVSYVARRIGSPGGTTTDDIIQVGYLGLISAIERYDPERGGSFVSFAVPTIMGVIKHYLRDHTWAVKVPRRLRELGISLRPLRDRMEQELGRTPTVAEMAEVAGISSERLAEAMELEVVYEPASLDSPLQDDQGGASTHWESMGGADPEFRHIEDRELVRQVLAQLDERQRFIIASRFYGEASQSDVAKELGISQMHVSRQERRALQRLRELLVD